ISRDDANHHPTYPLVSTDVGVPTVKHPSVDAPTIERPSATSTTESSPIDANSRSATGGGGIVPSSDQGYVGKPEAGSPFVPEI
ncbi:hypothetical protein B296_00055508, partial [Ensete ventricosum]